MVAAATCRYNATTLLVLFADDNMEQRVKTSVHRSTCAVTALLLLDLGAPKLR